MENEDILKTLHKILEHLNTSPSSFLQEYGIDINEVEESTISEQFDLIIKIIEGETAEYYFTPENVSKLLEKEEDEQCRAYLVGLTKNNEYIENYIKTQNIREIFKTQLTIFTKDRNFIEECINVPQIPMSSKGALIEAMGAEYIKSYLENSKRKKIPLFQEIDLVIATHDSKYIQEFINKLPPISSDKMFELIMATNDEEYIIKTLKEKKFADAYKLMAIKQLLKSSTDSKMIQDYINELRKELDSHGKIVLAFLTENFDDINKYLSEKVKKKQLPQITLPPQMSFGIEIETVGEYAQTIHNAKLGDWFAKEDSSLNDYGNERSSGVEVVSPILDNNGKISNEIEVICYLLKSIGLKTNRTCAGHIHIGADYLSTSYSLTNFLYLIENSEDILYILSNEEGTIPRDTVAFYAEPFTTKLNKALEEGSISLNSESDLESFIQEIHQVQKADRYIGINFYNLGTKRNTIEFRMPNGTLNSKQWIENINLFGGIVKTAEEIMVIQSKPEKDRTEEEKQKLKLFSSLPILDDDARLNALLDLTIDGDKTSYITRYNINKEMVSKQKNNSIYELFAIKKGMIKPKKIVSSNFPEEQIAQDEVEL